MNKKSLKNKDDHYLQEYFELQEEYISKYGEKAVVLYQIGNFYEIWGYYESYCKDEENKKDRKGRIWNKDIGHAIDICKIMDFQLAMENKNNPYGILNPHKIGFPAISYKKHKKKLLANGYIIIRIDQEKDSNNNVTRYLAEICSSTINFDKMNKITNNIISIYIEYQSGKGKKYENFLITSGISVIDIITGVNKITEFYSKVDDQILPIQEIYRFLTSHSPKEIIIYVDRIPEYEEKSYIKFLEKNLELERFNKYSFEINKVPSVYKKNDYQIEFLNKLYNYEDKNGNIVKKTNLKIIEELELERLHYGRISYILLLSYCNKFNSDIITKIPKPDLQWLDENRHLILAHNAAIQLDLIDYKKNKKGGITSLMSVLDKTETFLGRRMLKNFLQNPMVNPNQIKIYYDMVEEMFQNIDDEKTPLWLKISQQLKKISDITRLQRKLNIKIISPSELTSLFKSYLIIIEIHNIILNLNKTPNLYSQFMKKEDMINFMHFISKFQSIIESDNLESCYIFDKKMEFKKNPFKKGNFLDIDKKYELLIDAEDKLAQIVDHLNSFLIQKKGKKLEYGTRNKKQNNKQNEINGVVLKISIPKAAILLKSPINTKLCGVLESSTFTTKEKIITSDKISSLCAQIDENKSFLNEEIYNIYKSLLDEMSSYDFFLPLENLIAKLDLISNYAKISYRNNYFKPEIIQNDDYSFFEAKDLRHPIIEKIIDSCYITNDISLGKNGMILYGTNSCGKSSMVKAIALSIIMAQIGCYTPCKLKYNPYSNIITRLTGSDNLFQGQSSFEIEMSELRTILRQANSRTLVVGDELCSGTEHRSGLCLSISSILSLIEKKSTFIFATHMHELLNYSYIKNIPPETLKICHLSISYDEKDKILVYDRKLKEGSGLLTYGLMVAQALGLPREFINLSNEILLEVTKKNKQIIETKQSKYNSKVYIDSCAICNASSSSELHTHHILEQHLADEKGFIENETGIIHKNSSQNLIVLCKNCHEKLHHENKHLKVSNTPSGTIVTQ
jgi:DNA mismatch repair protein MutS